MSPLESLFIYHPLLPNHWHNRPPHRRLGSHGATLSGRSRQSQAVSSEGMFSSWRGRGVLNMGKHGKIIGKILGEYHEHIMIELENTRNQFHFSWRPSKFILLVTRSNA